MRAMFRIVLVFALIFGIGRPVLSGAPNMQPLVTVIDLNLGEQATVQLSDGSRAMVELLNLRERRDKVCDAVRQAVVTLRVNGKQGRLVAASYHLPQTIGGVQVDCAITRGYVTNSRTNAWGLKKAARIRLWPAGSPWIRPATFQYPVRQRWFATLTQMANVPVFVDGGEVPGPRSIYYHSGLDFGGAEGCVDVVAATDGVVVSVGDKTLPEYANDTPVKSRYDVVYVLDARGWYYRYSHLQHIAPTVKLGMNIKRGAPIGVLGKEGASGGWSHTHFEIKCRQPSGEWGTQQAYAFAWQAYVAEYQPKVIANARPHHLTPLGQAVTLDASKSWTASGHIKQIRWFLSDGPVDGAVIKRQYDQPGMYCETVRVTDDHGNYDYDFAVTQVVDMSHPKQLPPSIHVAYAPTFEIRAGTQVTFKVRSFRTASPATETLDFGDGSPRVTVHSDGNADAHAPNGYAVASHAFAEAGDYIVSAKTTNRFGYTAEQRVWLRVSGPTP